MAPRGLHDMGAFLVCFFTKRVYFLASSNTVYFAGFCNGTFQNFGATRHKNIVYFAGFCNDTVQNFSASRDIILFTI